MKSILALLLLFVLLGFRSETKLDPDVVAWWSFDGNTTSVAKDQSGNNLDARNSGAVQVEGKIGKGLKFDGKSVLEVEYQPILDHFQNGITVMAWVKKDESDQWNTIVSREIDSSWSEYIGLAIVKNKPLFSVDPDGKKYTNVSAETIVQPGIWIHLAGTFDNHTFKLFVNGQLVKSGSCDSPLLFHDHNPLLIGGNSNNQKKSLVDCFNGTIDEVKLYNRALTVAEIKAIFENTK
jgi:hypothetical protein